MRIRVGEYGKILQSREEAREAAAALRAKIAPSEIVELDFAEAIVVGPGWLDEFLQHLGPHVGGNVEFLPTDNATVLVSLPVLAISRGDDDITAEIVRRALERMERE